jgi:hypothetical protein
MDYPIEICPVCGSDFKRTPYEDAEIIIHEHALKTMSAAIVWLKKTKGHMEEMEKRGVNNLTGAKSPEHKAVIYVLESVLNGISPDNPDQISVKFCPPTSRNIDPTSSGMFQQVPTGFYTPHRQQF